MTVNQLNGLRFHNQQSDMRELLKCKVKLYRLRHSYIRNMHLSLHWVSINFVSSACHVLSRLLLVSTNILLRLMLSHLSVWESCCLRCPTAFCLPPLFTSRANAPASNLIPSHRHITSHHTTVAASAPEGTGTTTFQTRSGPST